MNAVLDDVSEYQCDDQGHKTLLGKHKTILIHGSHVCMFVPAGTEEKKE